MMDSDDDDIYPEHEPQIQHVQASEVKMEDVDDEEEGEEIEDDESDDEINFITDVKDAPKQDISSAPALQQKRPPGLSGTDQRKTSTPIPIIKPESTPQPQIQHAQLHTSKSPTSSKPGSSYPARHTSTLDPLNGNPTHPLTNKPLLSTDLDTDFGDGEDDKPWRKPGADVTDFFNYGFDEFTWASYCLKKQQMGPEIKDIKDNQEQLKSFLEGMGGFPGMPGMPAVPAVSASAGQGGGTPGGGQHGQSQQAGMPTMPGMPSEADMQQMFQSMMTQGIDPSQMDQNQFMQMMMGGAQPNTGASGFGGQQQPPSGPAMGGYGGGFDQGGFGGGGGRGRGRRGRGNW